MERERPDYLPPIPARRWNFPWLGLWAVFLLGMAGAGIWLHLKTNEAWTGRFSGKEPPIAAARETVINVLGSTTRDVYDYCEQPSCSN